MGWAEGTIVSRRSMAWIHGFMLIRGQVEISVIHNPIKARSVSVTPLTSDDWEILVGQFNRRGGHNLIMEQEQHASFLENNLLSQLRGAQKGQVLDVWVMGRTKIRIRVGQFSPCYSVIELTHKVQTPRIRRRVTAQRSSSTPRRRSSSPLVRGMPRPVGQLKSRNRLFRPRHLQVPPNLMRRTGRRRKNSTSGSGFYRPEWRQNGGDLRSRKTSWTRLEVTDWHYVRLRRSEGSSGNWRSRAMAWRTSG